MARQKVFICYSHEDEKWQRTLVKYLRILEKHRPLELWVDTRISAGSDWKKEIQSALASARVAILLVSIDFLESDFIKRVELRHLLTRQAKNAVIVIPVIVQACPWKSYPELERLQALPKHGRPLNSFNEANRQKELTAIAGKVLELTTTAHPGASNGAMPPARRRRGAANHKPKFAKSRQSVSAAAAEMKKRLFEETAESVNRNFQDYSAKRKKLRELQLELATLRWQRGRAKDSTAAKRMDEELKEIYLAEAAILGDVLRKSIEVDEQIAATEKAVAKLRRPTQKRKSSSRS